jgi:hypothetical protein
LQIARAERPDNPRQDPRLELIMQNMPARRRDRSDGRRGQPNLARETSHVPQRITLPAEAADFLVIMGITISADIKPGNFLRP